MGASRRAGRPPVAKTKSQICDSPIPNSGPLWVWSISSAKIAGGAAFAEDRVMDRLRARSKVSALRRAAIFVSVLVLLAGGVAFAQLDFETQRVDRDTMTIESVRRGTMEVKVSANGRLLPKNIEHLVSRVTGRIAKTYVKPGDAVTPGQLLLELNNPQLLAAAEEAQSAWEGAATELQAAESELRTNVLNQEVLVTQVLFALEKARLQLETEEQLFAQKAIAENEVKKSRLDVAQLSKTQLLEQRRLQAIGDNIEVQLEVRRSRVVQSARALDRARDQAENLRIVAGIAGIVQTIDVDVGQQLQAGSPIGRIAEHRQLYAELKVPAREAGEVAAGQKVVVDTRRGVVDGKVVRVDPSVVDGSVVVDVELLAEPPSGSRPQLPIEGTIYLSELTDILFVGKPAHVKTDSVMVVYKLDRQGRYATRVKIRAGRVSLNYLEILEGLEPGDRIITSEAGAWQDQERILIN